MSDQPHEADASSPEASVPDDAFDAELEALIEGELMEAPQEEDVDDLPPLDFDLPEDPVEATDLLVAKLRESKAESASHLDQWQRAAADFENLRKRSMREQQQTRALASERVVNSLLSVLDSFQAALDLKAETENETKLLGGMEATYTQLMDVLRGEGLEPVAGLGAPFDPTVHEAISRLGEDDDLVVIGELRRGYRLRDKVLRPAMVAVGPPPSDSNESDKEDE